MRKLLPLLFLALVLVVPVPARAANQAIKADGTLRLIRFGGTDAPANMTAGLAWEVRNPDGTLLDSGTGYGVGSLGKATYEGYSGAGFADPEFGNTATLSVAVGTPLGVGYELKYQSQFYASGSNTAMSAFFDVATTAVSGLKANAIIADGDSISTGYQATDQTHTYPRQLFQLLGGFASNYDELNEGEYGITVAAKVAAGPSAVTRSWVANYPAANVTFLVECGTNDIAGGATNDATIYNNIVTYANSFLTMVPGSRLILRTLLPRQISSGDSADLARKVVYDAVNARIRGKVGLPTSTLILDDAALPQFAYPPSATYIADGTHPTNAGYTLMAQNSTQAFATSAPAAPASASGSVPFNVSWGTLPTGAADFRLYRDGGSTAVYDGPLSAFTDSVQAGSFHAYAVSAYNAVGESAKTALPGSSAAGLVLTVTGTGSSRTLNWTADPRATLYKVKRSTDGINYVVIATTAPGTQTYTDTARPTGTVYYTVSAVH